jgi:hypothetical protein
VVERLRGVLAAALPAGLEVLAGVALRVAPGRILVPGLLVVVAIALPLRPPPSPSDCPLVSAAWASPNVRRSECRPSSTPSVIDSRGRPGGPRAAVAETVESRGRHPDFDVAAEHARVLTELGR